LVNQNKEDAHGTKYAGTFLGFLLRRGHFCFPKAIFEYLILLTHNETIELDFSFIFIQLLKPAVFSDQFQA